MLPVPFRRFIPRGYEIDGDASALAMAAKADEHLAEWKADVLEIAYLLSPERAPAAVLDLMIDFLNADIQKSAGEAQKRRGLLAAIASHKTRGEWLNSVKPIVDAIAGGDAKLVAGANTGQWIITGDGNTPSAYYWGTIGGDGVDDELGLGLIGAGDEVEVAGNVYIDTDNNSLTSGQLDQIEASIEDSVPAYFRVFLGYIDGTGTFVEYRRMG